VQHRQQRPPSSREGGEETGLARDGLEWEFAVGGAVAGPAGSDVSGSGSVAVPSGSAGGVPGGSAGDDSDGAVATEGSEMGVGRSVGAVRYERLKITASITAAAARPAAAPRARVSLRGKSVPIMPVPVGASMVVSMRDRRLAAGIAGGTLRRESVNRLMRSA